MTMTGLRRAFAAAALALLAAAAGAGTTTTFTLPKGSDAASRDRQVSVYVPSSLTSPAPMLMALHGCQQTQADVLNDWGLKAAADRYGFVLVAPFITSYDGLRNANCWGFWFDSHRHEGRGEVGDLFRIGQEVERRWAIDPNRRYIAGLSSGAAMSVVAAVAYNEYWAAAASASGLGYGEDAASVSLSGQCPGSATFHTPSQLAAAMRGELNDPYPIPLMVLQNRNDCTVLQQGADNLRDAQLLVFADAAHATPAKALARQGDCAPVNGARYDCRYARYTADANENSRSLVETVYYTGPLATPNPNDTDHGHYWIGGADGNDGKWSIRSGPVYPEIVWDFFARHPRSAEPPPPPEAPQITLRGDNPLRLTRGQAFADPGATATDPQDGSLPVEADCSDVNAQRAGTYACRYRATDRDGHVATATRTVIVSEPASCATASASPSTHLAAGRAVAGGLFGMRALAGGDRIDIGSAWDWWSRVTLYQGPSAAWYANKPASCP